MGSNHRPPEKTSTIRNPKTIRTPPLLKTRWMTSFCAIRNRKAGRQKGEMGLNPLQWGQQLG